MENINIIEVKNLFDELYDFNIYRTRNKRHEVYARKTFTFFCRKLDFTYQLISESINVDHSTCMHYIGTIHTISRIDKIIFNKAVDYFKLNLKKFEIKSLEPDLKKIKLEGVLEDFNVLLELNDIDIKEFKETRLKPFMLMKRNLKKTQEVN